MKPKIPVAILGATGMVGQRLITLLAEHPWFEITALAASEKSAGLPYEEAVQDRWMQTSAIPESVRSMTILNAKLDSKSVAKISLLAFSAIDADKETIQKLEEEYAARGLAVVSNNSAHRWTQDVPMIIPEVNPHHLNIIKSQRAQRGWTTGCLVVKPNCSIQSYVPALHPLSIFGIQEVSVATYQAISGAGKTLAAWPEMQDNVIPYIAGEEEKSEREPLKIWGAVADGGIIPASSPIISATCVRVPISDGHLASVSVRFEKKPKREDILTAWREWKNPLCELGLPSAPHPFLIYSEEDDRPQTRQDRNAGNGMAISIGRLREDRVFDWKFVCLSHNTLRGAAGGAVLTAELLVKKGWCPIC